MRQTRDGQLWRGRLALVSKDERSKGEKGGSEMAGGLWLSRSGRAKAKDPGGRWLCFKKNIRSEGCSSFGLRGSTTAHRVGA